MAVQSTYSQNITAAFAGMLADNGAYDAIAMVNTEASASIAFGRAVMFGSATDALSAELPVAETAVIAGILMHSHAYSQTDLDATGVIVGATMNVLRKGRIWVTVEDAVVPGDRLWVRGVAGGDPEFLGGLLPADDSTDTVDCTGQGQFLTAADAGGLAVLEVDFTGK
jgi:hypothetical protein